jgi:hypothetical protein
MSSAYMVTASDDAVGAGVAGLLADQIRQWDLHGRPRPQLSVYPAVTPLRDLPGGFHLTKRHTTIVISWADHNEENQSRRHEKGTLL